MQVSLGLLHYMINNSLGLYRYGAVFIGFVAVLMRYSPGLRRDRMTFSLGLVVDK